MNLKSVAGLAFAALVVFAAVPASANANTGNAVHIETNAERSQASFYGGRRGFGRHHYRIRYAHRGHRTGAPHIRRMRHALVRAQLGLLALQIRRVRYARHYGPRVRLHLRGGRYRVIAPRPQFRRAAYYNPRGNWRNHRLLNRRSG